jgi:hypothetical protein
MQIDAATAREDMRLFGALRIHSDRFGTGPKIGTVRLPNFKENNEGYTKTEPTRSDEEILKDIAELAKKHAEKGTFHNADNEYLDLYKEYVSSVSPDRENILTNSLKEIFAKANSPKKNKEDTIDINKNILQQTLRIMEQAKNKNGNTSNKTVWLDGEISGTNYKVGWLDGNELKEASFYDSNGEKIADYSQNGWALYGTKAENERGREILAVYNEAFNSVYNAQNASPSKSLVSGTTFDVVG